MKRHCAYCGSASSLTREHIWPKCIIKRAPELKNRLVGAKVKVIKGELTIADVCQECNNKKLTKLDRYLCGLYDRYFSSFSQVDDTIDFEYNYELLLRSLLKISYNSSRTMGMKVNYLEKYKDFILHGGGIPADISVLVELIPPTKSDGRTIYPHSVRSAEFKIEPISDWVKIRIISLNSYYFYLVISSAEIENIPREELTILIEWAQKTKLTPEVDNVKIITNNTTDALEIHKDIVRFKKS